MIAPASDSRPGWAAQLPALRDLQYVQALLTVVGLVLVSVWLVLAVVRDPRAVARIGRKQLGA